jgi:hypothetical protein
MAGILYPEQERGVLADAPLPPGLLSLKNLWGRLMASAPGTAQQTLGASGSGWAPALNTVPPETEFDKPRPEWTQFLPDLLNVANGPMKAATVFHGSPHKFTKFDISKIGTGEGAQAYGNGLYFSEAPSVAKTYQGKVSAMQGSGKPMVNGKPIDWDDPVQTAAFEMARHNGDRVAAADFYERTFKKSDVPNILRSEQQLPNVEFPGNLYKVDLPDEAIAKMLDWDAPLSKQPESVRKALGELPEIKKLIDQRSRLISNYDPSGNDLYAALSNWKRGSQLSPDPITSSEVSRRLNEMGIPGIKYLDQGSRAVGKGTSNYVVFDDQIPKIIGTE